MDTEVSKYVKGIITGVIGLVFLLFPLLFVPPFAESIHVDGLVIWALLLNIPCIILAIQTKSLLNRSKVFGALFISSGLLCLYLVGAKFCLEHLAFLHELDQSLDLADLIFPLFIFAPSIVTILVGVSLIIESIRELRKRKEAVAREIEDQIKSLDEQLGLGHITQEEYEQKKKKLLEKHQAR